MVIQVSADDFHGFVYPGGALALEASLTGVAAVPSQQFGFGRLVRGQLRLARHRKRVTGSYPLLGGYEPAFGRRVAFFEEWLRHPAPGDPYWEPRRARPDIKAAPPVSLLGGWHDILIDQTLDSYQRLREAGRPVRLVVGPWTHTSGFNKDMPVVAGEAISWLRRHLTTPAAPSAGEQPPGESDGTAEPPARVHVSEAGGRGQWRDFADWPPPGTRFRLWHPHGDGTLSSEPASGTTAFLYDPADPTPAVGGPRMDTRGSGPQRNNDLENRGDVVTFTSPPLGAPLEVTGPVSLRLHARGSSRYFDVFARLCDVDTGGVSWNVCDGILRTADAAGWNGYTVAMSSTAHRFGPGHRIRLQVSGGAHPRYARNTGTAGQLPVATKLVPVQIELDHASAVLSLPVLPGA
jgi:hypothetical protein